MADWNKDDKPVKDWGQDDEVVGEQPSPGWFQPGSRSEAAVRGFSQGATLGFGDEIQAYLRALGATSPAEIGFKAGSGGLKDYFARARQLKDEERAANEAAAAANPASYIGGAVVGSLPQAANIANVARGAAPILKNQMLGSALSGSGLGAAYGAAGGAGSAKTMQEVPKEAARGAGFGAVTGAITGGVTGKAVDKSRQAKYDRLAREGAAPVVASAVTREGLLPGLGALGNVGRVYSSDESPDWATDPYSAAIETGKAGVVGALAGYGINKAGDIGARAGAAIPRALTSLGDKPQTLAQELTRNIPLATPSILGTVIQEVARPANPFDKISSYLRQQGLDENDPDERRRAAMDLASTEQGRATMNDQAEE